MTGENFKRLDRHAYREIDEKIYELKEKWGEVWVKRDGDGNVLNQITRQIEILEWERQFIQP
ncbi:MAG: hypothetical protein LBM98_03835 [Oscillospiraceae bacterium]|jgi:hypothetical protein|nr:hypothetical protein [Oscillospiraceae bacterium]